MLMHVAIKITAYELWHNCSSHGHNIEHNEVIVKPQYR